MTRRTARGKRSVHAHNFSTIPSANIPRSTFQKNETFKTTMDSGELIPHFVQEVVPGDTHLLRAQIFARMATPIHPLMDNLYLDQFYFFVPNRIIWENWVKFMGEQENPGDSTDFTIPKIASANTAHTATGSLWDYFGLPLNATPDQVQVSCLPWRALTKIYNEWFRSQDLTERWAENTGDGPDTLSNSNVSLNARSTPYFRQKRHDYFTSCLPWPQKGPGVDLPLGDSAKIKVSGLLSPAEVTVDDDSLGGPVLLTEGVAPAVIVSQTAPLGDFESMYADLSSATASTINDLRQAFQIQKLQERDARGGTRYQELVLSHFGVRGGDARLQRPEYLGGSSNPIQITQVPQTSETAATPQGSLAGYATANGSGGFSKSFTEHGYIIGLMNVRADLTYQQGVDRHWSRSTKYDFYWPALAKIGEQAVLNKEIYADGTANDALVFGYQERWAEMRYGRNKITGKFRSEATGSLDPWHLAEDFAILPELGDTFITSDPPVERVVAVTTEPQFLVDCWFNYKAVRPMPINSAPGYIDHF